MTVPGVLADEHPGGAEAFLGEERVGPGENLGGRPMGGDPKTPVGASGHRAGLAAGGQQRPGLPLLAEGLHFCSAFDHEGLAVLRFDLACSPRLAASGTGR